MRYFQRKYQENFKFLLTIATFFVLLSAEIKNDKH